MIPRIKKRGSSRTKQSFETRERQGGPRVARDRAGPIGRRICERLALLRLTQNDLQRRAELSNGYVSKLITGEREPSVSIGLAVAHELECSPRWLWLGEGVS